MSVTNSEAYLAQVCERVFLRLWSFPNLYRDQGRSNGGDGKELCDLLVVFGRHVIIFSDKHCQFKEQGDINVLWRRWYRDAVQKSVKQLAGAERWLTEHPTRIFMDRACSKPLPIKWPTDPVFHRIATCRGIASASRAAWGGTGSLMITNQTIDSQSERPFHLGCFDERGRMHHVLDEVALDLLLSTMDTVSDFVDYLVRKEAFFRRHQFVTAAGEENLVGLYLQSLTAQSQHDFILPGTDGAQPATGIFLDESFWQWWQESKQRSAKAEADKISYAWDRLVEKFSFHMMSGTEYFSVEYGVREQEEIVRWMARESRFRRRLLASALVSAMGNVSPGQIRRRCLLPQSPGDPAWIFVVVPRPPEVDYERYREVRRWMLTEHGLVLKYLNPELLDIVCIAVDTRVDEMSEDAAYFDMRHWTQEQNEEAREIHERTGIFKAPQSLRMRDWEFPIDHAPVRRQEQSDRVLDEKRKKKKRRAAVKEARRRNR